MNVKKAILTLAIIATAVFAVFTTSAFTIPTPQQPFIECASTHWVTEVASGSHTFADGITEDSKVQGLRDVNDNAYCGQVRAANQIWEGTGVCESFDANLYQSGGTYVKGTRSKPACGSQGVTIAAAGVTEASGTFYTIGDVFNGTSTFDFLQSPNWTVN